MKNIVLAPGQTNTIQPTNHRGKRKHTSFSNPSIFFDNVGDSYIFIIYPLYSVLEKIEIITNKEGFL